MPRPYDFLLVHGSGGHACRHWYPWLYQELHDKRDYEILVPCFPSHDDNQRYDRWAAIMDSYADLIDENTVVIAHSLGPVFISNWLIDRGQKVKGVYFIAPVRRTPEVDINALAKQHKSFYEKPVELEKLADLAPRRTVIHSDADAWVDPELSKEFARKIQAQTVIEMPGRGHFVQPEGMWDFPELLEMLLAQAQSG